MAKLDYDEILGQLTDEELDSEYGWHRTRGKEHRRAGRYGLYWWHQAHAHLICDEIGRRSEIDVTTSPEQLTFAAIVYHPSFRRVAPDDRGRAR